MSSVVEEGTGTAAALEGIDVAGKTGTAEVGANRESTRRGSSASRRSRTRGSAIAVTVERTAGPGRHGGRADREAGDGGAARRRA